MGRTLTATFTLESDIFVHVPLPPCLCAELSVFSLWSPDGSHDFHRVEKKKQQTLVQQSQKSPDREEKRWGDGHCFPFISVRVRFLCKSSALLQPRTASPPPSSTGSTTAILWQAGDGCAKEGERIYAPRSLSGRNQWTRNVRLPEELVCAPR